MTKRKRKSTTPAVTAHFLVKCDLNQLFMLAIAAGHLSTCSPAPEKPHSPKPAVAVAQNMVGAMKNPAP